MNGINLTNVIYSGTSDKFNDSQDYVGARARARDTIKKNPDTFPGPKLHNVPLY